MSPAQITLICKFNEQVNVLHGLVLGLLAIDEMPTTNQWEVFKAQKTLNREASDLLRAVEHITKRQAKPRKGAK